MSVVHTRLIAAVRVRSRQLSLLTALLILTSLSFCQPYYFRHYQVENGLSNNTVFYCVQDKMGFIWLGTKDGLDRFDGYSFKVFGSGTDSSDLGDSYIRCLYISPVDSCSIYVGTRIGVYKYNALTEKFTHILQTKKEVTSLQQDKENNLWIVSGNRLIRYNESSHTKEIYSQLPHCDITCVSIAPDQNLYVGTADGFIEEKMPFSDNFVPYNLFGEQSENAPRWIERLFITADNKVLAGTSNFGVKLFDPNKKKSTDILAKDSKHNGIYARDFTQLNDSIIWMGTESGIFIYNTRTSRFTNLINETGNPYSLSDNAVYTLCVDKEGGVWAGTYSGGINYYHPQYSFFAKYFPKADKDNSLSGNVVREICPDSLGNLWIGTEDAGLNKLNLKTNQITQYTPSGSSRDISYPNIHGLLAVGSNLLIGTFEHGLDIMDIPSGKIIAHYPDSKTGRNLKSLFIVNLFRSKEGVIYVGTRSGLYTFNLHTQEFTPVDDELADCFIHTLSEDRQGNIWIGTMGNGLFMYNPVNKKLMSLNEKLNSLHNAGTNWITTTFPDKNKNIWIGTEGCGLIKYNATDNTLDNYSTTYGFPGTTVYRIMEDNNNTLWITTSGGLVHFDSYRKKIIKIYTIANGLLSEQFNYDSGFKDSTGRIYFGSVKGMISFDPATATAFSSRYRPPLYITDVASGKEHFNLSEQNKSLLYEKSKIILTNNQSTFSVQFAALSYIAPEMTMYSYNMKGLDKQWRNTSDTKISFTSLPPGNYELYVQATAASGEAAGKTASLNIKILPSFWQSKIAYLLYTVSLLSLFFYIFRIYHLATTEKNKRKIEHAAYEKEKEIYKNKIEFFTNVAHEIRTPLTLIKAPLEKIIKQTESLPAIRKHLFTMQRNTDRIINLSDELLDFRKTEISGYKLNLVPQAVNPLIKEIVENFEEVASAKNISTTLFLDKSNPSSDIDREAFIKIITNLMNNAVKYASHMIIIQTALSEDNTSLMILFKNDGEKISSDMSEKIFEPFYRSESAKSKSGSGLGLTLARTMALLHGGSLVYDSTDSVYNTFILTLSVSCNSKANNK